MDQLSPYEGQSIDLVVATQGFHLDSAGRAMFNVNLDCVKTFPKSNNIVDAFNYFLKELPRRSFSPDQSVAQDYVTENEDNKQMWAASKAVHDVILEVVR